MRRLRQQGHVAGGPGGRDGGAGQVGIDVEVQSRRAFLDLAQHEVLHRIEAYSPDLNPIEMACARLKALIRRAAARTYEDLWRAVGHVCDLFTEEECYSFFKAAGYETN